MSKNTVSNWVGSGLNPSDPRRPLLFKGDALNSFHAQRRALSVNELQPGQFKCFKCKVACFPDALTLSLFISNQGTAMAQGCCTDCGGPIRKILSETECDAFRNGHNPNTTKDIRDELDRSNSGGIGISGDFTSELLSNNDRIIYEWQKWAGRFADQTKSAHLAAVRDFEHHTAGKDFQKISTHDVSAYRNELLRRAALGKSEGGMSRSTVRHRVSHLSAFFTWLGKQAGHRHLVSLEGWFDLPKGLRAISDEKGPKPFPTLEEAALAMSSMPTGTPKDRRDRALFATAFVSGLREQALVTLSRRHIDTYERTVTQQADVMRAKNGKSYVAEWFPRTEAFQAVLLAWLEEVDALGMQGNDALFPGNADLMRLGHISNLTRAALQPMKTASAVDAAFKVAWRHANISYTPHSARHTLAKLGEEICTTPKERKAWSMNLGHATESITVQHYGKMTRQEQADVFETFDQNRDWTKGELKQIADYHVQALTKGTPEFEQAQRFGRSLSGKDEGLAIDEGGVS